MTDKITTYTYFLESKDKMEPLLKELFGFDIEIDPNIIQPIPEWIDKTNKEEVNEWILAARGFFRYTEQYYSVYKEFSVISIDTDGFAGRLFTEFAKQNNLSYFSKIRNSSLLYYKDEKNNFMFDVDFQIPEISDDFDMLNCIDLSKVGIDIPFKYYENKFHKKEDFIFSVGNSLYNSRINFESKQGQKDWNDFMNNSNVAKSNESWSSKNIDNLEKVGW